MKLVLDLGGEISSNFFPRKWSIPYHSGEFNQHSSMDSNSTKKGFLFPGIRPFPLCGEIPPKNNLLPLRTFSHIPNALTSNRFWIGGAVEDFHRDPTGVVHFFESLEDRFEIDTVGYDVVATSRHSPEAR